MGTLPRVAKGELRECVICGVWYPERDYRILKREKKWVCKKCNDTVTDKERAESLRRVTR